MYILARKQSNIQMFRYGSYTAVCKVQINDIRHLSMMLILTFLQRFGGQFKGVLQAWLMQVKCSALTSDSGKEQTIKVVLFSST
jgi:hypothetical protein